jgi:hypothetical protein
MKLVLALIGLASCAFAGDTRAVASACGPDSARFDVTKDRTAPVANNDAAKAQVYVITDGDVQTIRIGLDGAWVGAAEGRSWFSFLTEPGEHHLCANWQPSLTRKLSWFSATQSTSLANFTAEAGKVYYFRAQGIMLPERGVIYFEMAPTNSDEGQYLVSSYPLSTPRLRK